MVFVEFGHGVCHKIHNGAIIRIANPNRRARKVKGSAYGKPNLAEIKPLAQKKINRAAAILVSPGESILDSEQDIKHSNLENY